MPKTIPNETPFSTLFFFDKKDSRRQISLLRNYSSKKETREIIAHLEDTHGPAKLSKQVSDSDPENNIQTLICTWAFPSSPNGTNIEARALKKRYLDYRCITEKVPTGNQAVEQYNAISHGETEKSFQKLIRRYAETHGAPRIKHKLILSTHIVCVSFPNTQNEKLKLQEMPKLHAFHIHKNSNTCPILTGLMDGIVRDATVKPN